MATITITVTVAGGKFVLDGVSQATYTATPGNTYKFDQSEGTNATHPLRLSTTSDGTHNSGSAYTTGVTTSGTPGSSGAYTQIEVTGTTPQALYYYCSSHSGMGGSFNTGNSSTKNLKEMSGFAIENLSADPVPFAQAQINNPYVGSWSSGGNLNTAREWLFGSGTLTAGWVTGGRTTPADNSGNTGKTEKYDGSSWAETGDMSAGRNQGVAYGTQTAGLASGGYTTGLVTTTEEFGGTSWTSGGALNTARRLFAGAGTQTAGVVYGGAASPGATGATETYNGTAYTNSPASLNTARESVGGSGTNTAAFCAGGGPPNVFELWNGTSWTESTELNTDRDNVGASGTTTDAIIWGGDIPPGTVQTLTEAWNGSAWTEVSDLATARRGYGTSNFGSTGKSAFSAGGTPPGVVANTEEWAFTGIAPDAPAADYSHAIVGHIYYNSTSGNFKAIKDGGAPIGTWSAGGTTNTGRRYLGGVGTKTAGLIFGGANPGNIANTESYNGTAWSEVNDLNSAQIAMGSAGTSTSGMSALGATSPNTRVEDWNGTCWSSNPHTLNSGRQFPGGDGPSNDSAIMVGGEPSPNGAKTEIYNGSTWTEVNDLNSGRNQLAAVGTTTAALAVGGSPVEQDAELWNGTSWTEVADLSNGGPGISASGDSELALAFAGHPSFIATNEAWNGTAWTEVGDLATGRNFAGSSNNTGNTSAFIASGEGSPGFLTSSEEWTAADFEIKTITTS
jgi:hypothetical protein